MLHRSVARLGELDQAFPALPQEVHLGLSANRLSACRLAFTHIAWQAAWLFRLRWIHSPSCRHSHGEIAGAPAWLPTCCFFTPPYVACVCVCVCVCVHACVCVCGSDCCNCFLAKSLELPFQLPTAIAILVTMATTAADTAAAAAAGGRLPLSMRPLLHLLLLLQLLLL